MTSRRADKAAVNRIFGEELPQASTDETAPEPDSGRDDRDAWLRDNVPPHHI
jgi:hypothetical protein